MGQMHVCALSASLSASVLLRGCLYGANACVGVERASSLRCSFSFTVSATAFMDSEGAMQAVRASLSTMETDAMLCISGSNVEKEAARSLASYALNPQHKAVPCW